MLGYVQSIAALPIGREIVQNLQSAGGRGALAPARLPAGGRPAGAAAAAATSFFLLLLLLLPLLLLLRAAVVHRQRLSRQNCRRRASCFPFCIRCRRRRRCKVGPIPRASRFTFPIALSVAPPVRLCAGAAAERRGGALRDAVGALAGGARLHGGEAVLRRDRRQVALQLRKVARLDVRAADLGRQVCLLE
jgi:hypothetical protein